MLTLAFNVQTVKANGTIYIRADGSIDPPTVNITTADNITYTFTGNIYDEIVVERSNIIIDGNVCTVQGTGALLSKGIHLSSVSNVTIKNTNIRDFDHGVYLESSFYCVVSGNNVTANDSSGIGLYGLYGFTHNNVISENNVTKSYYGVYLDYSLTNNISRNNLTNNGCGIGLLEFSNNNAISKNNIITNNYGIILGYSSNNSIYENDIINNSEGIHLSHESSGNVIYHNNFINNTNQVGAYMDNFGINIWDDGYPSGGNYWRDYNGTDLYTGPSQDLHGSDGIGDTPYIIDANNVDHYPLMNPYGAPPPQAYALTITTTVGGTTDPAPGTYSYTVNSTVQVTAVQEANYLFDHWELNDVNVGSANPYAVSMDKAHTLKAVFSHIPPPLSVSISPVSASINVGDSLTFTSTVTGGTLPYSYQWYLNEAPVPGANESSWTFTPTTSGIYYAYLKVTDAKGNTTQSGTARITVAAVPVGGYSLPIKTYTTKLLTLYLAIVGILTVSFTMIKRKTHKRTKRP